jgi:hypothetical protein
MAFLTKEERKARKRAGLCGQPWCDRPVETARARCRPCLDAHNAAQRRRRAELISQGLCVAGCGQTATDGRLRCAVCMDQHSVYVAALNRARMACGLCWRCGARCEDGKTLCPPCGQKHLANIMQRQHALRTEGLCVCCSQPSGLRARCDRCRKRFNAQERARRRVQRLMTST